MRSARVTHPERTGAPSARERILLVAARLYARQGYEGTSMREIAAAAGVTKSLVSYHFGSKQELFSSLLRESIGACRAAADDCLRQDIGAGERLHAMLRCQFARAREAPEVVAFAHEVMTMPGLLPLGFDYKSEGRELFEAYVRLIEDGQKRGEFRRVEAHAVVVIAIAAVGMYVAAVLSGELERIPAGTEDTVFDLVVHGIGGVSAHRTTAALSRPMSKLVTAAPGRSARAARRHGVAPRAAVRRRAKEA